MTSNADARPAGRRPSCLVTGASGAIGPSVVRALAGAYDVRVLSRRPPAPDLFGVPVQALTGDIVNDGAVRRAAEGVDVIVHLAALLHIVDPPPSARAEYERVNVSGTTSVMEAARAEGVSRVVLMSTIAVYGKGGRTRSDETSPVHPDSAYGETKLAAERIALAACRRDGVPLATVLRSAAVYGPRIAGNYQRLVRAIARRRFVPVGPGDNVRTLVFERDLAAATLLAAGHEAAAGRVFNVSDGATHTVRDIVAAICTALGRRPPRWHAPVGPVRAAVRAASLVNRRLPAILDKYMEDVAVDATRIQIELGFCPAIALVPGWAETVAGMRRHGLL